MMTADKEWRSTAKVRLKVAEMHLHTSMHAFVLDLCKLTGKHRRPCFITICQHTAKHLQV
jgi:hypothetical protein